MTSDVRKLLQLSLRWELPSQGKPPARAYQSRLEDPAGTEKDGWYRKKLAIS